MNQFFIDSSSRVLTLSNIMNISKASSIVLSHVSTTEITLVRNLTLSGVNGYFFF